jgi:hypothetical protein
VQVLLDGKPIFPKAQPLNISAAAFKGAPTEGQVALGLLDYGYAAFAGFSVHGSYV